MINDDFMNDMQHLINCAEAEGTRLHVESTSRCRKPGDNPLAVDKSDHALGMATDSQPIVDGKAIDREQMDAAWCAFNMNVKSPCKDKYGNHPPPKDSLNTVIHNFLMCAKSGGLSIGVTYKGNNDDGTFKQDGNHFQRGHYNPVIKDAYQQLLKRFCNSQCPHVPKGYAGQYSCDCAGY